MIISFEYIPLNGKIEDNDAEKDDITDADEKFQLISVKMKNTLYLAYGCSNQFGTPGSK